jgi:maltose/moltooligosaccharide transporter
MEPYRAFVSDKLPPQQHATGFLSQSFFTGLGITLANLTPGLLVAIGLINKDARSANNITHTTYAAFIIGAVVSIGSIMYSILTTKEYPLSEEEVDEIRKSPKGVVYIFKDIVDAFRHMPPTMRQLGVVYFFNWYAMFVYWQFITLCVAQTIYGTNDPKSAGFTSAQLLTGTLNGTYNVVTFCVAFLLAAAARRTGAKNIHMVALLLSGSGLLILPFIHTANLLVIPMIGFGIGWASMMGTPYVMLAGQIPTNKTGVYMGILNMFIVFPMLLETVTFRYIYNSFLGANPVNAILFAGTLIIVAALLVLTVKVSPLVPGQEILKPAGGH